MARYNYKAKKGVSETVEGVIDAVNQDDALNKLLSRELFPISIVEVSGPVQKKKSKREKRLFIRKKVSSKEILNFIQKLTTLVRAKVELLSSLRILYEQTDDGRLKEIILEIYNEVKEGKTFSESLERFPLIFSSLFISIIKSGEASGRLDFALEQISEFLCREESLRTKISVALAYPALLLMVGLASIMILMNFVIPKLRPIFEGVGRDLPVITRLILNISDLSHKSWFLILGAGGGIILFLFYQRNNIVMKKILRRIKTNIPVVKRLIKNQELAHFSRSLSLLLNSGVAALRALEVATFAVEDPKLKDELKQVYQEVASGQSLAKSMGSLTGLPGFFIKMIAVGEESGRLGEILEEISRSYTQQIEVDISLVSSLLEPVLILGLGVVLGTIILAILLPTFQITQIVR